MAPWQWILGGAVALGAAYLGFRLLPGVVESAQRLGSSAEGGLNAIGGSIVDFFTGGQEAIQEGLSEGVSEVVQETGGSVIDGLLDVLNPFQAADAASGDYSAQATDPALAEQRDLTGQALVDTLSNRLLESQARGQQNYIDATASYVRRQRELEAQPTIDEQIQIQRESAAAVRAAALAELGSYTVTPTTDQDYFDQETTEPISDPLPDPDPTTDEYQPVLDAYTNYEINRLLNSIPSGLGTQQPGQVPAGVPTEPVNPQQDAIDQIRGTFDRIGAALNAAIQRGEAQGIDEVVERRANIINRDETIRQIYSSPDNSNNPVGLQTPEQLRARLAFLQSPAGRGLVGSGSIRQRSIATTQYQLYRLGESDYNPYANSPDPR